MKVAIYFKDTAFTSAVEKLMGRNVAGETFMSALIEFGDLDCLALFVDDGSSQKAAFELKKKLETEVRVEIITATNFTEMQTALRLFMPGPDIGNLCYRRSFIRHTGWSTCGITHTTSTVRVMDGIAELLSAPIQPWDAVICTSPSVKSHALEILDAKKNYLVHRFGIQKLPTINLPVIPLGVDTRRFENLNETKESARKSLAIKQDEVVVSFVGRLSWHAKANPLPMYIALSEVAKMTGKKVTLLECGWYANDASRKAFLDTQSHFAEHIRFLHVDGRGIEAVNDVYASSDIFISLSDNIQETFGITPIEAMSAGVPVVVSDWDGYRHSVRDGVDGFRIRTLVPDATHAQDLIYRYEMNVDTYDYYCGHTSMSNIVDVGQLIERLSQLVENAELRREMGEAGKRRAREVYDWSVIIGQYKELWSELDEIRMNNTDELLNAPTIWPERLDPMIGFKEYPTGKLKTTDLLTRGAVSDDLLDKVLSDHMLTYAKQVVAPLEATRRALASLGDNFTAGELSESFAPGNVPLGMRLVASLIKFDIVRIFRG